MAAPSKGEKTRHYGIGRWVDYARGLEPDSESARMTAHAERCGACRDLMTFCVKLSAAAGFLAPNGGKRGAC